METVMFFVLLANVLYVAMMLFCSYMFLPLTGRRHVRQGAKYIWVALKMLMAIVLSPWLLVVFFCMPLTFLDVFTLLWPHLDILRPDKSLYLRRFFMTPKTQWYRPRFLHYIAQDDEGRDPHDHPGPFKTTILHGGYVEKIYYPHQHRAADFFKIGETVIYDRTSAHDMRLAKPGDTLNNPEGHTHMVKLTAPTWSWVVGWKRGRPWGFWILDPFDATKDHWIESEEYGVKGEEIKSWEMRS
jgi:hypothetical protein